MIAAVPIPDAGWEWE